ncbi:MAG: hypothetical protein ACQSGP_25265 [Frankia sp.]
MLAVVLIFILVYVVLGIIGFVVDGLLWLFVIALILFLATVAGSIYRAGRVRGRRR